MIYDISIELNNSYCIARTLNDNIKNKFIGVCHKNCSFTQYYYVRLRHMGNKPQRKSRELTFMELNKDGSIKFPRGWLWDIYEDLELYGLSVEIVDKRPPYHPVVLGTSEKYKPYSYQSEAVEAALSYRYGILKLPTGSGKSLIGAWIISQVGFPGLIMVPSNKMLMYQFRDIISEVLPQANIGLIGDGSCEIGDVTIGVINSLHLYKDKLKDFYKGPLQFLLIDEGHHIREGQKDLKNEYFDIALNVNANMKIALTATPGDRGTLKRNLLVGVTGGVIYEIDKQRAEEEGIIVPMQIFVLPVPLVEYENYEWSVAYDLNQLKNQHLYSIINEVVQETKKRNISTLIICDRVEKHLKSFEVLFPDAEVLYGKTSTEDREDIKHRFEKGEIPVLISTIIKEGISIKNIECLILASGGKDADGLIQKIGRGLRSKEGKTHLTLIDFKFDKVQEGKRGAGIRSLNGVLRKHSMERIKTYKKLNYEVNEIQKVGDIEWKKK